MPDIDTAGDDLLRELRDAGLNNQEIAAQLRLHPATVGRLLRGLDGDTGPVRPHTGRPARGSVTRSSEYQDPRETDTAHYWRPVIR